jgi:hypothetical protein
LYAAHTDEERFSWYNLETDATGSMDLSGRPSRLARLGDQIVVSLRSDASLAVLEAQNGSLVETQRMPIRLQNSVKVHSITCAAEVFTSIIRRL